MRNLMRAVRTSTHLAPAEDAHWRHQAPACMQAEADRLAARQHVRQARAWDRLRRIKSAARSVRHMRFTGFVQL